MMMKVLNSPINKFQKMAAGPSVSSMSLDESHILQLLQGSNIDSEDEIEGEDAYLNDIIFSHSADIDFDDDGWEEIIETGSRVVAHQVMKLSLINRPNQQQLNVKSLLKLETVRKRIIVIVYLLVTI